MKATRLRIWICVAVAVAGIAGVLAFLFWPLAATGDLGLPPARSVACGSALDRGPAYEIRGHHGTFVFVTAAEAQVIPDCDALRARNRWAAFGVATGVVGVLATASTATRRRTAS